MHDFQEIDDLYGEEIIEMCFEGSGYGMVTLDNGVRLFVDYYKDHVGGLEGWYSDTYEGIFYVDNEAYNFTLTDTFCSETIFTIDDKDPEADLREGDMEWVDTEIQVTNNNLIFNKEETAMTEQTKFVTVKVIANDKKEAKQFQTVVVKQYKDVHVPAGEQPEMTILKLAMNGSLEKAITAHNEERVKRVNQDALNRNGAEVPLQPLDVTDMEIQIREA
jgi:hypothetical protein